jgi:Flp pilus assembly protein TadD
MNFLLLGSLFFKNGLEILGHKVVTCGLDESCDIRIDVNQTDVKDLLRHIPGGTDFDFVVLVERLGPTRVFPKGIRECPISTVFYSVDTHLNFFWHREYARVFDFVFTTQRDYVEKFKAHGIQRVFWLPWSIDTRVFRDYGLERTYDIVFVGTMDPSHRRKRSYLIEELSKKFRLDLFGTQPDKRLSLPEMAEVYSQARIVLNESIFREVNFRVFEAMACGPLLLTEKIGNGLFELFQDRKHLVVFDHTNFMDLAAYYLKYSEEREAIADSAKQIVTKKHSHVTRARELVDILQSHMNLGNHEKNKMLDQSLAKAYFLAGLRLWPQKDEMLRRAETLLSKAARYDNEDWVSHLYLGMVYANREDWERAEENYLTSINKKPDFFHSHVLLANVYVRQGKDREAKEQYRIAGECAPNLSKFLRQRMERAIEQDIKGAEFHFCLGRIYEKNGMTFEPGFLKDHPDSASDSAAEYYSESIRIDPTYPAPWMALAKLLFGHKLYDTAIPIYEEVVRLRPQNAKMHSKLGLCYAYCYKKKEAWRELFKSYCLNPRNGRSPASELGRPSSQERGRALLELGHAFYDINRLDQARKHYRRALTYDPQNPEIYAYLGIAHLKLGQMALARWNLEKSLNLEPMNTQIRELLDRIRPKETVWRRQ